MSYSYSYTLSDVIPITGFSLKPRSSRNLEGDVGGCVDLAPLGDLGGELMPLMLLMPSPSPSPEEEEEGCGGGVGGVDVRDLAP
jgi:hypothetical protein